MFRHPERSEGSRAVLRALRAVSYYVYIMSSKSGVLYIGATNDLDRRVFQHKQGLIEGFTKKYRAMRLIYVEQFDRAAEMVARERQLKGWTRSKKLELIHSQNPEMLDYARRTARDPSLRQPPLRMTRGTKAEGAKAEGPKNELPKLHARPA
jgi:putative endonuclease